MIRKLISGGYRLYSRKADAKTGRRRNLGTFKTRAAEQHAILSDGARYVCPGGTLVYITCSILDEENGAQVGHFLSENPEFEALDTSRELEAIADGASQKAHHIAGNGVLLTPLRTETDGFFAALLRRR